MTSKVKDIRLKLTRQACELIMELLHDSLGSINLTDEEDAELAVARDEIAKALDKVTT